MTSNKTKFLSAAATAAVLLATVAVAHTVHNRTAPADQPQITTGKVVNTPSAQTAPAPSHGVIVCGMALDSDCEKLETLLPM
jgi:hypothetical protein